MKTIVAGSREITDPILVEIAIASCGWQISMLIHGAARGVDTMAEDWAVANGVPVFSFPANWDAFGKKAGMIRNRQMAMNADALVAVWDGKSRGTANMIRIAEERGLRVFVYRTDVS